MTPERSIWVRVSACGLVLVSAIGGCQAVGTPQPQVSYYEHDGMWCRNYGIGLAGARVAALITLTELKMPVYHEGPYLFGIFIDTRTPENLEARVMIFPLDQYGKSASIGIRIGGFGTHPDACKRLLDEIARRVDAVQHVEAVAPVASPVAVPGPLPLTIPSQQSHTPEPLPLPAGRTPVDK